MLWPWTQPLLPFKVVFSHSKLSLPQLPWPFCRLWQSLFMKHSAKGQILHRRFMHFENPMLIKIQMPKAWALIDTKKTQGLYSATSHQCGSVQTWSTWLQICSCTFVSSLKKKCSMFLFCIFLSSLQGRFLCCDICKIILCRYREQTIDSSPTC